MFQDETGFVSAIAGLETGDVFRPRECTRRPVVPWPTLSTRYGWTSIASAPAALRVAEQNYLEWLTRGLDQARSDGSCAFPSEEGLAGLDAETKRYALMRVRAATLQLNDLPTRFELVVTLHFVALRAQDAGSDDGCVRFAAPVTEHAFEGRVMTPMPRHLAWLERDGEDVVLREQR